MPLQDLTPQLRTRLNRMEKTVGWFVTLAMLVLLAGVGLYVYQTAQRRGWLIPHVIYSTSVNNAAGIHVGDPVKLMGFEVGEITKIEANKPADYYNVTLFFKVRAPYYGYLWTDSKVKVAATDFLGNRALELKKGKDGLPTVLHESKGKKGLFRRDHDVITGVLDDNYLKRLKQEKKDMFAEYRKDPTPFYQAPTEDSSVWLEPLESPALTEELGEVIAMVKEGLPGVLLMTNKVNALLSQAQEATSNLNNNLLELRPTLRHAQEISGFLTNRNGGLGDWVLPADTRIALNSTLANADTTLKSATHTMTNVDAKLDEIAQSVTPSLMSLAAIMSNLRKQVDHNTNILSNISQIIVHSDDMVQGLKRHWLLRSAFKTNAPNARPGPTPNVGSPRSRQP